MKSKCVVYLFLIFFVGLLLRILNINSHSFWCDEFLAISLSRIPNFLDMLRWIIKNDAHPPLFYSIIRAIFQFTKSEFGLRFVPFLFGTGAVVVFYRLLREGNIRNYLLPLALFAFSPAAILWSQMVKSYSMLTFFTLLSVLMFFSYVRSRRPLDATLWVLSSLITLYLHNYGVIVVFAQALTLFLYKKKLPLKIFLLPSLIILLVYLPYLAGPVFSQISFVKGATHTITNSFLRIAYTFFYFVFGETISPLNLKFVAPGIILFLTLFLMGVFSSNNVLYVFSSIILSIGIIIIVGIKTTIPQNLVHLQPFFFILIALGIEKIFKKRWRVAVSIVTVLFLFPSLYYYYRGTSLQYHDASKLIPYKQISELIQKESQKGEVIIFTEPRSRSFMKFFEPESPWDWYYKGNLPLIEFTPSFVSTPEQELEKIFKKYDGFWLLLNYGFREHSWNNRIKNFFLDGKSVKIKELKMVKNYSFLDFLRGKGKNEYYFLEVYHMKKGK